MDHANSVLALIQVHETAQRKHISSAAFGVVSLPVVRQFAEAHTLLCVTQLGPCHHVGWLDLA